MHKITVANAVTEITLKFRKHLYRFYRSCMFYSEKNKKTTQVYTVTVWSFFFFFLYAILYTCYNFYRFIALLKRCPSSSHKKHTYIINYDCDYKPR